MASIERIKGSNGSGEAVRAVVQSLRTSGSSTLDVDSVTNWSGDFIGTYGTPDGNGSVTPSTVRVFYGTVSGTDIDITGFAPGYTDNGNVVGDIVVLKPTTAWADNIAEILALTFNDDGTLKTGIVTTAKLAAEAVTPLKVAPSTLIATVSSVSSGSVVTSYTIATDDGNFASGVWTAPYDCIIQVSAAISFNNQANTAGGGRLDFEIQKNSASHQPFWGVGRAGNSVDDITAAVSIPVQMATGDTIRINNLIVDNAGTLLASRSRLGVTILSVV